MNITKRRLLRTIPAFALSPWLAACDVAPTRPLTIASLIWPGYELMFLAQREGWLPRDRIRFLKTASTPASLAALASGEADGAALTLDEVVRARARSIPLTAILVFDVSAGADMLLARPGIDSLADLAGKRVGVEPTALGAVMLHKVLQAAHLQQSALTLIPLNIDAHQAAWLQGGLDALITFEPTATRLIKAGARRLYDSRRAPNTIFDVLAVTPQAIERHPDALTALVAGHFRALRHLRHNPQDAAYRMAARMGIPASEVLDAFRGLELPDIHLNRQFLDAHNGPLTAAAEEVSRVMLMAGLLQDLPTLNGLARADFLPESV